MIKHLLEGFDLINNVLKRAAEKINGGLPMEEGILPPRYEILGTIIEEKGTFNILDKDGQRMLVKNYPSLKQLLTDLAANI